MEAPQQLELRDEGTIVLVRPLTPAAARWLRDYTDGTWFGPALVVEHRFVQPLIQGFLDEFAPGEQPEVMT
jgi:hypothetical protein